MAFTRTLKEFIAGIKPARVRALEGLGKEASWIGKRAKTFVFDIDNTLTHGEDTHLWPGRQGALQRRFIPDDDNILQVGENWDEWNQARANAIPNLKTINLVKDVRKSGYNVIGVTARTREADSITRKWLTEQGLGDVPFISRPLARSEESSSISKGWAIDKLREQGVNPVAGIEDSASNVKMFNERNVPHALIENGEITQVPPNMPRKVKRLIQKQSTGRQMHNRALNRGGYIDDPVSFNPLMKPVHSVSRMMRDML